LASEVRSQVEVLRKRNRLTDLADRAIVLGERNAYEHLRSALSESEYQALGLAVRTELAKVEHFYRFGTRLDGYVIPVVELFPGRGFSGEEDLATEDIIGLLLSPDKVPWKVRGRAAWMLGRQRPIEVTEALATAIRTEPNLDVLKECVFTFEENTGYRAEEVFDTGPLLAWWEAHRDEFKTPPAPDEPDPAPVQRALPVPEREPQPEASGVEADG
jgi:hypothetical protein